MSAALVLTALASAVLLAGCGGSKKHAHPILTPRVLKFDGPNSVACTRSGQTRIVPFKYVTKNAVAVRASLDHRSVGAPPSYPPNHGTVNFGYVCPGPHMLKITAVGGGHVIATSTATFGRTNKLTAVSNSES